MTAIYGFTEHKKYMAWRLNYICKQEKLSLKLIDLLASEINKNSEFIVNASIKYNFTHSDSILNKIINSINILICNEKTAIENIMYYIKVKYQLDL